MFELYICKEEISYVKGVVLVKVLGPKIGSSDAVDRGADRGS